MKQIIVNVSGLTTEEKQRVNEALAKIKGIEKLSSVGAEVAWLYAPSQYDENKISWNGERTFREVTATHTSQQVLEMAGVETSTDQHVYLADKFIITDSSGRIVYDGTLRSISSFIKSRVSAGKDGSLPSSGFSVKTDENGVAVMVAKRKVRADFDLTREYSVDVSSCTEDEKKEVQQAFFDVGLMWEIGGKEYQYLDEAQYTNTKGGGLVTKFCMYGTKTKECNMTPTEFLKLVYEPEQQGHVHSRLMALYAEDAKTTDKPWELWQIKAGSSDWISCKFSPAWDPCCQFRRKPKTHTVNGVEVPDLRFVPKRGDRYYLADPTEPEFTYNFMASNDSCDTVWAERGLCYENTEAGKQAASLHAKAWLGIA